MRAVYLYQEIRTSVGTISILNKTQPKNRLPLSKTIIKHLRELLRMDWVVREYGFNITYCWRVNIYQLEKLIKRVPNEKNARLVDEVCEVILRSLPVS